MPYPHAIIRDFSKGWDTSSLPVEDADDSFYQAQMPGYSRPFMIDGALFPQTRNLFVTYKGRLSLRGGEHAVTTDLGHPPQGLSRYQNPTLQRLLVGVNGSVISYNEAANTQTTLSTGQSTTAQIEFVQFYDRVFWCDGSKVPQKWDGVSATSQRMGIVAPTTPITAAATAPTLFPPTVTPTVSLGDILIDPLAGGTWTADTLTGGQSNRLPNADFSSTYSAPNSAQPSGRLPTGWTGYGQTPDMGSGTPAGAPAGTGWVNQDTPGDGIYNTTAVANDQFSADSSRWANQVYVAMDVLQSDPNGRSSVILRLAAYSDTGGTALLATQSYEITPPDNGQQPVTYEKVFSFASFSTPIKSYRLYIEAGANARLGTNTAVYVRYPVLFPFAPALTTNVNGAQIEVHQPQSLTYTGGSLSASRPGVVGSGAGVGVTHLTCDYVTNQNWSQSSVVTLGLAQAVGIVGMNLRLALRQNASATRYYSNPFTFSADGSSASCNLATIPLAVRQAFRYAELVIVGDFTVPISNGDDLFLFGPLTGSGNLGVGFNPYSYVATEVNDNGDPATFVGFTQSNASPVSATVAPTPQEAEATVSLGTAIVNGAATHRAVYRYGGVFNDNPAVPRLIAVVPIGADVAYGTDTRNPDYSWNHTTGVLTDNTPDSLLTGTAFPHTGLVFTHANAGNLDDSFAGGLPYQYYATFVNAAGVESNPTPISADLNVAGSSVQLSAIPVSADPQVTARNLYRQGGTVTVPRFLATLADNTTTTYTDNTADAALSLTALSFSHDPPQTGPTFFSFHKNRIFAAGDPANPYRMLFSSYGLPEYWPLAVANLDIDGGYIDVDPTFADGIVGFCGTGSLLVIAKANSIHVLLGDSWNDFVVRKVASYGCISRRSLVRCKNQVLFLGPDGMVYALTDDEPQPIALPIEATLRTLTRTELAGATACYSDQRYLLFVPRASGAACVNVCYDFRAGAWSDLSDPALGATATYVAQGQELYSEVLFATKAGYVNPAGSAFNGVMSAFSPQDAGATALGMAWQTPDFEFGRPTFTKRGKALKLEGVCQFSGAAPTAIVTAYTPGRTPYTATYSLSASASAGVLLDTNLDPALIGKRLSVTVSGTVTEFELNTLDVAFQFIRERA